MICKPYPHLGECVYETTLPNGLLIRVVPKRDFAKTHAFLAVNYGSIDQNFRVDGISYMTPMGVAHYLEHKMFDMPDGNAMQMFSEYGGSPNAFTSYDMTAYYVECTDHVKENLKILLQFVTTPWFTAESVEKERGIIEQEIRMYEDNADSCMFEDLYASLFASHPIRNSIAGTVESIQDITEQTLYDCYHAFYTPANMMLCVVGDVEAQMVFDLAEEIVPWGNTVPERDYGAPEIMQPVKKRVERQMEVSIPAFALGFKTEPSRLGADSMRQEIIGDLAAEILVGESSALYTELYEKNLIDSGFSAGYEGLKGVSMLTASGDSLDPEAVAAEILREADRIRREGVNEDLFQRLKRSALGRRIRNLDSFSSICYRMCAYQFEETDCLAFPERFHEVEVAHIAEFLERTVCEDRMSMAVVRPRREREV